MADAKRKRAYRKGFYAEFAAKLFLMAKGYRIVATRYRCKHGEIDLVARRGALAVFVEVKARADVQTGVDSVTPLAMRRIRDASDHWLSRQRDAHLLSQRYDIIAVTPWALPKHFIDAF